MSISDKIPGMKSGSTLRNIIVSVLYLFLSPLVIIFLPVIIGILVSRNYGDWAETLSRLPGISTAGGWKSGIVAAVYMVGILLVLTAITGGGDASDTDSTLEDDTSNASADAATTADSDSSDEDGDANSEPEESSADHDGTDSGADTDDPPESSDSDETDDSETENDAAESNENTASEEPVEEETSESTATESETQDESSADSSTSTEETSEKSTPTDTSSEATDSDEPEATDEDTDSASAEGSLSVIDMNVDAGFDTENEYVTLENTGSEALDMSGYTVTDRPDGGTGIEYNFPSGYTLDSGKQVRITTGDGSDTDDERFIGSGRPLWRADGDVIYVYNSSGNVVVEHPYGDQA